MKLVDTEIRAALNELPALPTEVCDWRIKTGIDSTDEPAAWIWAVLPDEQADFDTLIQIRDLVLSHFREQREAPFEVYVSFNTVGEMDDLR